MHTHIILIHVKFKSINKYIKLIQDEFYWIS